MNPRFAAALGAAAPPASFVPEDWRPWTVGLAVLLLSGFFAVLRSALRHSVKSRVLEGASEKRRARLAPLLDRADSLATSASAFEITCDLVFALVVLALLTGAEPVTGGDIALSLLISVPALLLVGELLPALFIDARGDATLRRWLSAFYLLQLPLEEFVRLFERMRRATLRAFGMRERSAAARELVEGLRDVIEDAVGQGDLAETEREIIENVMDFRDADVAEVMTPRTEIHALAEDTTLREAISEVARCSHSRLPVHRGSLDEIAGTVSAQDLIRLLDEGAPETRSIRAIMRPAFFVPETKRVSELLGELRRAKIKMAIVLDEYGGTAGLVTVGDVLAEIVGEFPDERDARLPEPIRFLEEGLAEVDAGLRVSEVNESMGLSLPEEEDYETLAGFVLAELGHFPKRGESFEKDGVEYTVVESSDRRVLRVSVRGMAVPKSA